MATDDTIRTDGKLTLYAFKGCPGCIEAKSILNEKIENGDITVVNVEPDSSLADFMTDNFGGVPALTIESDDKLCEVDINTGDVLQCVIDTIRIHKVK